MSNFEHIQLTATIADGEIHLAGLPAAPATTQVETGTPTSPNRSPDYNTDATPVIAIMGGLTLAVCGARLLDRYLKGKAPFNRHSAETHKSPVTIVEDQ